MPCIFEKPATVGGNLEAIPDSVPWRRGREDPSRYPCPFLASVLQMVSKRDGLSPIEFFLWLLASRALPVFRQILKGHVIVLCWIIDITADGADIFSGAILPREVVCLKYSFWRVVQVQNTFCFQVFIALGRVCSAIDGLMIPDKFTHTIQGFPGGDGIVKDYRQFVFIQRLINVSNIPCVRQEKCAEKVKWPPCQDHATKKMREPVFFNKEHYGRIPQTTGLR